MQAEYTPSDIARFHTKYTISDGCWLWNGTISANGYGKFAINSRPVSAHRIMWTLVNGPIPDGLVIRHSCDVKRCVSPHHLLVGTQWDNQQDAIARGRHAGQQPTRFKKRPVITGERHWRTTLTDADVIEMRQRRASGWTLTRLAVEYHIAKPTVWHIVNRTTWQHLP